MDIGSRLGRTGRMPVLVIFAPTACGKTELALSLFGKSSASPFSGQAEVISADSRQVYRGMDIGTAKPGPSLLEELPHHLVDVNSPGEPFSAGDFVRMADEKCREIAARGRLPVVLGGTGFYIRNFMCGLPATPKADEALRLRLRERLRKEGAEALHAELAGLDSASASLIHVNDRYRILRALEVCIASGKPRSSFGLPAATRDGYDFCTVILERDRQDLYGRINRRVDDMISAGLAREVEALVNAGFTAGSPGMQAIGYREFFCPQVLGAEGEEARTRLARDLIARDSRRYAKRQYTFMAGIPGARRFHADALGEIRGFISGFLGS